MAEKSIGSVLTRYVLRIVLVCGMSGCALGQGQDPVPADLNKMDLEDLMNVKVTSVSKHEESLMRTPAAVFVINQEDIRRSGATSIPDLLRMAPGVDVEQIDANAWAISIRGFNSRYSNKVLVLIDGRTVYSPSFSGVYWEQIDMPVENIDRIEVIRGPGAAVWGANAVNGVISIFTKSSKEMQGGTVTAAGGSQLHGLGLAEYGGSVGSSGSYRAFGQSFQVGNSAMPNGVPANDNWTRAHGGFRSDWDLSGNDSLMVEGDAFSNQANQLRSNNIISTPFDIISGQSLDATGGDLLARWVHTAAGGSQTSLQTYFDTYRMTDFGVPETVKTFDLDFQDHMKAGERQDIVWGLGYRSSDSAMATGYVAGFTPPSRTDNLFSAFFQDEIRLSGSVWLTLGGKLEHNPYTGIETEPSARLVWSVPGGRQAVWAAASKALRQPARSDTGIENTVETLTLAPGELQEIRLQGNPHVQDEQLRDYELGYRAELAKNFSLDAATFLSFYHNLETLQPLQPSVIAGSPMQIIIPLLYANGGHAVDYGGELSINWNATSRWRISPGYSYLHATLRQNSAQDIPTNVIATDFPQNMVQVRSQINLTPKTQFDQSIYYTARLPGATIPGHARFDLRLSRRLSSATEVSIVGQNLLRPRTMEYGNSDGVIGAEAVRSIYGKITWRF